MGTRNEHHPYAGPPIRRTIHYPAITDAMRKRCEERNVHLMDISQNREGCLACGRSEGEIAQRGEQTWRVPSLPHAAVWD